MTATTGQRAGGTSRSGTSASGKSASGKSASTKADKPASGRSRTARSDSNKARPAAASVGATIVEGVRNLLGRPLASYHLIVTLALLLTTFGLIMVLSASSVEGYSKAGSAYGPFATQVIFAILGLLTFYAMLRMSVRMFRRLAAPMMIVTTILLALVLIPGIGTLSQGARRWFMIYGLSVQPSELVKVALCLWGAHLLASRRRENASLKELLIPLVPVGVLVCLLIVLEPNLSTTITIAIIIGALLWFAGLPVKVFAAFTLGGVGIAVVLALIEGYRSQRVMSFLGNIDDPEGAGYQARQAKYALADGGLFGQGLGQGRAKWNYLPNAKNDFIFAIIGEELGLVGGLLVVALFLFLTFIGFRIAVRSTDPFLRLMSATITVLITAQAFINIGYVVGLLPVTGIQLPLISAGGTSTLTVLAMLGLLANAARHEPEAVAALATGSSGRMSRLLRLPTPVPYRPSSTDALRDRLDRRRRDGAAAVRRPGPRRAPTRPGERAGTDAVRTGGWRGLLPGAGRRAAPDHGPVRGDPRAAPSTRVGYRGADRAAPDHRQRFPMSGSYGTRRSAGHGAAGTDRYGGPARGGNVRHDRRRW
ncbi:putative lipid II flippase FtsW [Gordonia sinesedis]